MSVQLVQRHCEICGQMRPFQKPGISNTFHLLMCVFTCGGWVLVWIADGLFDGLRPYRCTFCGQAKNTGGSMIAAAVVVFVFIAAVGGIYTAVKSVSAHRPGAVAAATPVAVMPDLNGPQVEAAKRRAIQDYPALGVAGSPMNVEYVRRYKSRLAEHPEYFADPDWPTRLARECLGTK
jgi:hypothetical protein